MASKWSPTIGELFAKPVPLMVYYTLLVISVAAFQMPTWPAVILAFVPPLYATVSWLLRR